MKLGQLGEGNHVSDVTILIADLDHVDHQSAILRLLNEYAQLPMIRGRPLSDEVLDSLIPKLQQHPHTTIFLAYHDTEAVGLAICFLGFSTFAAKPLLNIHDLAVTERCRGQGIGRTLLARAEEKARELGCCKLTLEVDGNNAKARRVYEAAGFRASQHVPENGPPLFLSKVLG